MGKVVLWNLEMLRVIEALCDIELAIEIVQTFGAIGKGNLVGGKRKRMGEVERTRSAVMSEETKCYGNSGVEKTKGFIFTGFRIS